MATATSSREERTTRRAGWLAAAALALLLVPPVLALVHRSHARHGGSPAGFAWLRPATVPAGWRVATTPAGATLAYPPGWRPIESDAGTVSAAPHGERGVFHGYLNATPLGGRETLANWSRFRPAHVADEGGHDVKVEAAAMGVRFRTGPGSCVIDSYATARARFREIACIVAGARATTVVVATAPVSGWSLQAPVLERAVASFGT